ncbi:MAG: OmpH family outer membrane protein [Gammaproteobacteria bacterium]|nr:OmpH family outer membrane protein [Gammaproteobacteria bacterium]
MKKTLLGLMMLSLGGLSTVAHAEETKIGVVDLQKIIQTSPQIQTIQQDLEKKFRPRRDSLIAAEKDLRAKMEAFKRDSVVMNANIKKDKEREIVAIQQKFERDGQQYQQELSTAHNEAMEDFYTRVRAAIATIAKKEHFELVLQKDAAPFAAEKLDVTKQVITAIK